MHAAVRRERSRRAVAGPSRRRRQRLPFAFAPTDRRREPKNLPDPSAHERFYKNWGVSKAPRVWHIEPGRAREKGVLYAGTAPAGLFRTEDEGRTWEPVTGLNEHPTRANWSPGAGGMCAHSIQLDPAEERRMYVGISSAGGFRTDDGGKTWTPINCGVKTVEGKALKAGEVGT